MSMGLAESPSAAGAALKAIWGKRVDMALLLGVLGALGRGEYASRAEALADYNMEAFARSLDFDEGPLPLDEGEFEALRAIAAHM